MNKGEAEGEKIEIVVYAEIAGFSFVFASEFVTRFVVIRHNRPIGSKL